MEVVEVSPQVYADAFPNPSHVFNSVEFSVLNEAKCDTVHYLLFKDSKVRLGIIFGVRNNLLITPFSAPFGGLEASNEDIKLAQIDSAIDILIKWAMEKKVDGIRIVSPSFFYNHNFLNKVYNCLYRAGFNSSNVELNYQFPSHKFNENYQTDIWYNARKNLKRAFQANLTFEKLDNQKGKLAYDVIALNRKERGFPLQMSWEQVLETITLIPTDFFLVKKDELPIAAAVIYHVADQVVQVIYWGDLPEYAEFKTMNFLSFQVFQYYKNIGIEIVDIGPSTKDSIPNYGLCEFKESIGCDILIKTEFYKKLESQSNQSKQTKTLGNKKSLLAIDAETYHYYFPNDTNPFISEKFIQLNAHKVDRVIRLIPSKDNIQIGLIAGIKDGVLKAPFSAPFAGFHCKSENIYASEIELFLQDLITYAQIESIREMHITIAPEIYSPSSNAKIVNAMIGLGFQMQLPEIFNHVNLLSFKNEYTHGASRTYYNQAIKKGLTFSNATSLHDKEAIYSIIVANRVRMKRPIYMSFDDIMKTTSIFSVDFFKVLNAEGTIVAGAIMYREHKEIIYALFWGDTLVGRVDRAMDYLIFNLYSHYKSAGYSYIDLGISTEAGIPNNGLLRFKETHECKSSLRYSFKWISQEKS